MRKHLLILAALSGLWTASFDGKPPVISTTIDFLDYVFYDRNGPGEYYPLEQYEEHLREIVRTALAGK